MGPWIDGIRKKKYLSEIIRNPRFLSIPWESWESLDFFENEMTSQNPGKVWVAEDPAGVWILFLFQKVML